MALKILMNKYMHFSSKAKQSTGKDEVDFVKESNDLRNNITE